jgi:GNAT superfamily N-acetyltransferase
MQDLSDVEIRAADEPDARDIADVHVRGWRWAYRGQLPDEFLDALSVDRRAEGWRQELGQLDATSSRIWIAHREDEVIGFASSGPSHDQDADPGTAEVYAIYLRPEVVGTGVGRTLFAHVVDDLRRQGYATATLWVLETNARTRRFYEAAGWHTDDAQKTEELRGIELREVRYRIDLHTASG